MRSKGEQSRINFGKIYRGSPQIIHQCTSPEAQRKGYLNRDNAPYPHKSVCYRDFSRSSDAIRMDSKKKARWETHRAFCNGSKDCLDFTLKESLLHCFAHCGITLICRLPLLFHSLAHVCTSCQYPLTHFVTRLHHLFMRADN